MEDKSWREAFMSAMELLEKSYPDAPILLVASTYNPDDSQAEFPCACGARNMDRLNSENACVDMLSAILRTVFELCLDYASDDREDAIDVYEKASEIAMSLNMVDKDTVANADVEDADDIMHRLSLKIKGIVKDKLEGNE